MRLLVARCHDPVELALLSPDECGRLLAVLTKALDPDGNNVEAVNHGPADRSADSVVITAR